MKHSRSAIARVAVAAIALISVTTSTPVALAQWVGGETTVIADPPGAYYTEYRIGSWVSLAADGSVAAYAGDKFNAATGRIDTTLFVRDLTTGVVAEIPPLAMGAQPIGTGHNVALSGDGSTVVFNAISATSTPYLHVWDIAAGTVTSIQSGACGFAYPRISNDATTVLYDDCVIDFDGSTWHVSEPFSSGFTSWWLSGDGNLVFGQMTSNVWVFDRSDGTYTQIDTSADGTPNTYSSAPFELSADGTQALFFTSARTDIDGISRPYDAYDVFVKDLITGAVDRITAHTSYYNLDFNHASISADGRFVAYMYGSSGGYNNEIRVFDRTDRTYASSTAAGHGRGGAIDFADDGTAVAWSKPRNTSPQTTDIWVWKVSDDITPPAVACTAAGEQDSLPWFIGPVTVTCTATDDSGAVAPAPQVIVVEGDGADQLVVSDPFCDPTGNCASGTLAVSIDQTAPDVAITVDPAANDFGWHNTDVTLTPTCTDPTSGIGDCDTAVTITTDGVDQPVTLSGTDIAGNTTTVTRTISRDTVTPTLTVTGPADGATMPADAEDPTTCTAADSLSGINGECTVTLDRGEITGGTQQVTTTARVTDRAGNPANETRTYTVVIDLDAPEITPAFSAYPNEAGWHNAPVTVTFTCDDASGVATCADPIVFDDGAGQSATVTATDIHGNEATLTLSGINVDTTDPDLAITGLGTYTVAERVTLGCDASDALSGVAFIDCPTLDVDAATLTPGTYEVTATANDAAGNTTTVTGSYTIAVDPSSLGVVVDEILDDDQPGTGGFSTALHATLDTGDYDAFINQVEAGCCTDQGASSGGQGKRFTRAEADILIALATHLRG